MNAEDLNETIALLARTPQLVADLIHLLPSEKIREQKADGGFSILENACHLRDIEIEGYSVRIGRFLEEETPALADIDGGRLAIERNYNNQDLSRAIADFSAARAVNIARLKRLEASQFERKATMEGVGELTLSRLIEMMHEHDEGHIDELRAMRNSQH